MPAKPFELERCHVLQGHYRLRDADGTIVARMVTAEVAALLLAAPALREALGELLPIARDCIAADGGPGDDGLILAERAGAAALALTDADPRSLLATANPPG